MQVLGHGEGGLISAGREVGRTDWCKTRRGWGWLVQFDKVGWVTVLTHTLLLLDS